jgi:hypothetical protein
MPSTPNNTNIPDYNLDRHLEHVNKRLDLDILAANIIKRMIRALKLLQFFRPSKIEYVETGDYKRCEALDKNGSKDSKNCTCSPIEKDLHWDGSPTVVAVAMNLPITTFSEWVYNSCKLKAFRWSLQIMTQEEYLKKLQSFPDVIYDVFTYPVKTNYLTEVTTKAAIHRWLKTFCPKLNYNFELVKKDLDEVSKNNSL